MTNPGMNLKLVAKIINDGVKRSHFGFTIPPVTDQDLSISDGYITIITGNNPFEYIFGHLAKNRIKPKIKLTHSNLLKLP